MKENLVENYKLTKEQLKEKILGAIENAPDFEVLQLKSINKENEKEIKEMIKNGTVMASNLFEFRTILEEMGLDKNKIEKILSHENSHANTATRVGVENFHYEVNIFKSKDGIYLYQPSCFFDYPENWTVEEKKENIKKILSAPEEYGDKLSSGDIEKLKNLN